MGLLKQLNIISNYLLRLRKKEFDVIIVSNEYSKSFNFPHFNVEVDVICKIWCNYSD